jgi:hypothetical protein
MTFLSEKTNMNYSTQAGLMAISFALSIALHSSAAAQPNWQDPELKSVSIEVPPYKGDSYRAEVPDTLDLVERASLCINAITSLVNPQYDFAQYTYVDMRHDPPYMAMEAGITNLNPKWLEALPMLRIMSGSQQNLDVDHQMLEGLLRNTGFDGLTYQPPDHPGAFYEDFSKKQNLPASNIFGEGRQLLTWATWVQMDPDNPTYRRVAEKKIQRLLEIAAHEGDTLYFRRTQGYTPGQKDASKTSIVAVTDHDVKDSKFGMVGTPVAHSASPVAMGAARYYRVTGYEPALELARGLARYFRQHAKLIDESGRWHGNHFHIVAIGVLGQLEYALAAGDQDMLEWVVRAYEYAKSIGDPTTGFFGGIPPCNPCTYNPNADECGKDKTRDFVEPCSVADMILIALQLSRADAADYYEDVEYYVRNYLMEMQITDVGWIADYPQALKDQTRKQHQDIVDDDPRRLNYENVPQRAIGSFCCSSPNQWFLGQPGPHACGCCLGNAGRVLYHVWDAILEKKDDNSLRVNLLMNRASPWADLASHLPYEGKVVLKMKQDSNVELRIPSWANKRKVQCFLNGKSIDPAWSGNYIAARGLRAKDELTVTFPMAKQTVYRNYKGKDYWLDFKGFTVVDLAPHQEITPIFQRPYYRKDSAPVKNLQRFVSSQDFKW